MENTPGADQAAGPGAGPGTRAGTGSTVTATATGIVAATTTAATTTAANKATNAASNSATTTGAAITTAGTTTTAPGSPARASAAADPACGPEARPQRADARRNRDRLLEAAVRAFTRDGLEATLDAVAKDAGVGIGTLYRHFPTRESLVDAAYRNELTKLCESVVELNESLPPDRAMREWLNRFTDYMGAKRGMADVLRALIASGGDPYAQSRSRLLEAITTLLSAGTRSGALRPDIEPGDVLASLSGISLITSQPDQREQAGRLLDLLMDGLRYNSPAAGGRREE